MLKNYASNLFIDWAHTENKEFISLIEKSESLLDLGCGDGKMTIKFARKAHAKKVVGVDSFNLSKGIKIIKADLNRDLPFKDNSFDAVLSHFSLEHLYNTGLFISETQRILKPGGYTLIGTDNMASWANIISLIMGYQPFTTTCGITQGAIGNPFAIRANAEVPDTKINKAWRKYGEYSHNKVLSYRALIDSYKEFGFVIEKVIGVGYLPFAGKLSRVFSQIDKRHSHFLIVKARKVK